MQTYSNYRPTVFDIRGLALPDRQDWLVLPVSRTRDSECLAESNFASALEQLGGESETVEVHRFGHWGNGWFEIILVAPATPQAATAASIERALEDYPLLNEDDYREREQAKYVSDWSSHLCSDFVALLAKHHALADDTRYFLDDVEPETVREFYESLIPSGDYYEENSTCLRLTHAVSDCSRDRLAEFIRDERRKR